MRGWLTKRRVFQCAGVALVVWIEWLIASVPSIDGPVFNQRVTEIERTASWRYGYALQYHGAVLVKTRVVEGAPPLAPIDADDDIAPIMAEQLRQTPWKVAFELGFYAALWALWSAGLSRLRRRVSAPDSTRWRRSVALGLSWALMITVALLPYLIAGYGEPLFSQPHGPGALSYTTGGFGSTGTDWGFSLSYSAVVANIVIFPLVCLEWFLDFLQPIGQRAAFGLLSVAFYAIVAIACGWLADTIDRRGGRVGGN